MGVVPRPVAEVILENQIRQSTKMLALFNSSSTYDWNKKREYEHRTRYQYDSLAARIAAPIWLMVWVMTAGKMGRGLWKVETLTRERLIIDMPLTKPPALNQIPHVVNPHRHLKCTYGFTECSGRECHGRCTNVKGGP